MSNRLFMAMLISSVCAGTVLNSALANSSYEKAGYSRYQQIDFSDNSLDNNVDQEQTFFPQAENNRFFATPNSPLIQGDCSDAAYLDYSCLSNLELTRRGLQSQLEFLHKYPQQRRFASKGVNLSGYQLKSTLEGALRWLDQQEALTDRFDLLDISHFDSKETKFTGYYTPEIAASWSYSDQYPYAIYSSPNDYRKQLTRAEIDSGRLAGSGLEIAWVNNPIDLFYMHMQGSGVLVFADGTRKAVEYEDSNGHSFQSIANHMKRQGYLNGDLSRRAITAWLLRNPHKMKEILGANPRYVFFRMKDQMASTASGMSLIPGHTVAVDTSFIPFGSILLAEVPRIDSYGQSDGYEWRMLFPQDRGNAIKGQARVDLYTGTGEEARKKANKVTGFRRAYLLLDKSASYIRTASAR